MHFSKEQSNMNFYEKKRILDKKELKAEIDMTSLRDLYSKEIISKEMAMILRNPLVEKTKKSIFLAVKEMIKKRKELGDLFIEKNNICIDYCNDNKIYEVCHLESFSGPYWKLGESERYLLESFEKDNLAYRAPELRCLFFHFSHTLSDRLENLKSDLNPNCNEYSNWSRHKDIESIGILCHSDYLLSKTVTVEESDGSEVNAFLCNGSTPHEGFRISHAKYYPQFSELRKASRKSFVFESDFSRFLDRLFQILKLESPEAQGIHFVPAKISLGDDYFYFFQKSDSGRNWSYTRRYSYDVALEIKKEIQIHV